MHSTTKWIGFMVTSFGAGILVALFLPATILVILESIVIVTAGILFSRS